MSMPILDQDIIIIVVNFRALASYHHHQDYRYCFVTSRRPQGSSQYCDLATRFPYWNLTFSNTWEARTVGEKKANA